MPIERKAIILEEETSIQKQKPSFKEALLGSLPSDITEEDLKDLAEEDLIIWILINDFKVDHRPFSFDDHRYLIDIYACDSQVLVVMKAAQMGLTIYELLWCLHKALYEQPCKIGFYFPTSDAVAKLSKDRLRPLIVQNEELSLMIEDSDYSDTLGLKQIGDSSLYLSHMGGMATKDSTPLDAIVFDEVRLLIPADIDQTRERISHSSKKYERYVSTAGRPGVTIHAKFLRGDQRMFHSRCGCGPDPEDWVVLSQAFPDCIVDTGVEVFYQCPSCLYRIEDPQNGEWVVHNPQGDYPSFHIHQMLSHYITPKEILDAYNTTTNIAEFYNAKLGIPYVDEDERPVTLEILRTCENSAIPWGFRTKGENVTTVMGVDQRGGINHVVVAQSIEGKKRLIHLEVIDGRLKKYREKGEEVSPFKRLYQLMAEYDIDFCVCDALPNSNEAKEFGRAFPGRVFLAFYSGSKDMVRWSDKPLTKKGKKEPASQKKSKEAIKFRWTVLLDRYQSLELALLTFVKRQIEIPDPRGLVQEARRKDGRVGPVMLCEEEFYEHVQGVIREQVGSEEIPRWKWVNLGLDPHFLHAWNYCNIGLERLKTQFSFDFW